MENSYHSYQSSLGSKLLSLLDRLFLLVVSVLFNIFPLPIILHIYFSVSIDFTIDTILAWVQTYLAY